jgi:hypothetical protein
VGSDEAKLLPVSSRPDSTPVADGATLVPEAAGDRSWPRFEAPLRVFDVDASPPAPYFTRNVSLGGLFLEGAEDREVGSAIELLIEHQEKTARIRGRVTHLASDGFGVAFSDPPERYEAFMRGVIEALLSGGSADRRTEGRRDVDLQAFWTQRGDGYRGNLRDLSASGALVDADWSPELFSVVFLYLPTPEEAASGVPPSEAIGCAARVVHHHPEGFGVQFIDPSRDFRHAVEAAVQRARQP